MAVSAGPRTHIVGNHDRVDTIVLIHGIWFGHYRTTWTKLAGLIPRDHELPRNDVILWGYRTGFFKGSSLVVIGEHLFTDLRAHTSPGNSIALTGHSLGGLLVLRAVCDQLKRGLAYQGPVSQISWITLFGTPLSGRGIGAIARMLAPVSTLLNKQFRDLCGKTFCKPLAEDVEKHIYFNGADNKFRKKIPIRLHFGSRDFVIKKKDRETSKARFNSHTPYEYDTGHLSVKSPNSKRDANYQNFIQDIQEAFTVTFRQLSKAYVEAPTGRERNLAWGMICFRYEKIARYHVKSFPGLRNGNDVIYRALSEAAEHSQESDLPTHRLILHAVMSMSGRP